MIGKHKIATLGYFSLAAVGSLFALEQSVIIVGLSEQPIQVVAPIAYDKNKPMIAQRLLPLPQSPG